MTGPAGAGTAFAGTIPGATELERLVARSRLIGADPALVLHGGGNTSTKLVERDHLGRERRVIRIKGSGSDLATIEARHFPGLWLDELEPLREREAMSDEEMVAYLSRATVEPDGPRPSIETLLHAFLPAAHVDHVHADAICALANAPDPTAAVADALGPDVAVVEYVRPGFELSCRVADLAGARAVVLAHHGLVTWGETHEESYGLTLELVGQARAWLVGRAAPRRRARARRAARRSRARVPRAPARTPVARAAGRARGGRGTARARRPRGRRRGRGRAEHARPHAPDRRAHGRDRARRRRRRRGGRVRGRPRGVRRAQPRARARPPAALRPAASCARPRPRLRRRRPRCADDAAVRLELAAHSHAATAATRDAFGGSSWLAEADVHGFEYWPLELYKLTLAPPPPELTGTIAIVTGAASGIGRAVARDLAVRGAHVVAADLDGAGLDETLAAIPPERTAAVTGDLTDPELAGTLVDAAIDRFGGLDAVVLNAGTAATGELAGLPEEEWRRSLEVNLTAHFVLTKRALAVFAEQGIGGSLVYVASKNAFAPGAGFGPYSVAKAGLVQLMKIAALEGGAHGVRANAVNPDAVFGDSRLWSDEVRRERAAAHGVAPEELEAFYARRSLLGRAVTAADVAEAVAFLVSDRSRATTGATIPVDGGVPAAFPR